MSKARHVGQMGAVSNFYRPAGSCHKIIQIWPPKLSKNYNFLIALGKLRCKPEATTCGYVTSSELSAKREGQIYLFL